MTTDKKVLGLLLATLLGTGSAQADGHEWNWRGFYVGGQVGGAWTDTNWKWSETDHFVPGGSRLVQESSDWLAGGILGYNFQFGRWVVGVDGSLSGGPLKQVSVLPAGTSPVGSDPVTATSDIDWLALATVRLGYSWDRWLAYVKGGYAGANVHSSLTDSVGHGTVDKKWHNGWTVGAGVEYQFLKNISLGLEYNFVDLGSRNYLIDQPNGAAPNFARYNLDTDLHTVTARLTFRFDRPQAEPMPLK